LSKESDKKVWFSTAEIREQDERNYQSPCNCVLEAYPDKQCEHIKKFLSFNAERWLSSKAAAELADKLEWIQKSINAPHLLDAEIRFLRGA
jgi:hypothetical protein